MNYSGSIEGTPIEEIDDAARGLASGEDFWVRADENSFIPGFGQALVGAKIGEERTFPIAFNEEFTLKTLAGKTAEYKAKVVGLREKKFPEYDDDKYGTVTLQQFAHSIGITLYEGMWMSRAYSMKYPAEIKENMYFAIETFAGHPGLPQTCRLEENVLVTEDGPSIFTKMEHMEEAVAGYRPGEFHHAEIFGYPTK